MRLAACTLLALVACHTGNDGDDYYVEPGNGGGTFTTTGGGSGGTDAGGDGPMTMAARVCGLTELTVWDECDSIGLDGLMVMLGTTQATTRDDGGFDIVDPMGSNLAWRVSGNNRMPTVYAYPGDRLQIPSIRVAAYEDIAANAGIVPSGGAIFVRVMYQGAPVTGATGTTAASDDIVHYDDAPSSGGFDIDSTGSQGIVWFPNVTPGTAVTFTITPPQAVGAPKDTNVIVEANSATFATVAF